MHLMDVQRIYAATAYLQECGTIKSKIYECCDSSEMKL